MRSVIKKSDIFHINDPSIEDGIVKNIDKFVQAYTIFGKHTDLDDGYPIIDVNDHNAYAKIVAVDGQQTKYYVLTNMSGHMFNPISKLYEGQSTQQTSRTGRREWNYRLVTKRVFQFYIDFLRTKNEAYYNNAVRELS